MHFQSEKKCSHHRWPRLSREFFFINTPCGLILSNPQNGREDKGFVWEIESRR